jgi:Icc-related predicted phosphoesterase
MRLCVIADLHGTPDYVHRLKDIDYDLLVICGDITNFGHCKDGLTILNLVSGPYLAVHGNCDYSDVISALDEKGCNLHQKTVTVQNVVFAGFGGSNLFGRRTPCEYSEHDIYNGLSSIPEGCILVTHVPPKNTKTDIAFKVTHVGSTAVRQVIEEKVPHIVLCGHIHESRNIDYVGETLVVNPGEFSKGYYAFVSVEERKCWLEQFT